MNTIIAQEMGFRIEGDPEVLKDIVESIHEAYSTAGMDLPKRLNDALFTIERQLETRGEL